MTGYVPPARIVGVDFSGAADAGRLIWIADGRRRAGALQLDLCLPARALPEGATGRQAACAAVAQHIAELGEAVVGIDVPFGIPRALFPDARNWREFLEGFCIRWPDPGAFRDACRAAGPERELRRETDRSAATPFAPHNLRIYRMTWHGIAGLIAPLILNEHACAVPMQDIVPGRPLLMETCPASFLKHACRTLYRPYKGSGAAHRAARRAILARLIEGGLLHPPSESHERRILDDPGGDALDSVLAAVIALKESGDIRNLRPRAGWGERDVFEARVYF